LNGTFDPARGFDYGYTGRIFLSRTFRLSQAPYITQEVSMPDELNNPAAAARILIAEDEAIVAEDLALTVQDLAYHVVGTVSTGEEAIQLTEKSQPDLILMDIKLRGEIDGIQASERIRARFDIPVIFLTAYTETDVLSRAKVTEPYGFLAKPFSHNILQTTIDTALYKHAADKRVRESEDLYRGFFASSRDCVFIATLDGKILDMNDAGLEMLGYDANDKDQVLASSAASLYENAEDRQAHIRLALDLGFCKEQPLDMSKKDGTMIHTLVTTVVRRDSRRNAIGFQGTIRDVTEQKKTEEALRQSEEQCRQVSEVAFEGIAFHESGVLVHANQQYYDMLGYTRGELVGKEVSGLTLAPESLPKIMKFIESGACDPYEAIALRKDGTKFPIEVQIRSTEFNGRKVRAAAIRDISERKTAEKALRKSEEKFRLFMDNSPAIAWMKDDQGRHVYLSRTYEKCFGVLLDDWLGKTDFEVWSREIAEQFRKTDQATLAAGHATKISEETQDSEGKTCSWLSYKFPFQDSSGNWYVGGIGVDITDRKRAEEALQESEEKYRAIFEGAAEGILVADVETRKLRFANPALCQMFGYTSEEIVQLNVSDIHPAESIQPVVAAFEAIGKIEKILEPNLPCLRKDGSIFYADVVGKPAVIEKRKMNVGFFTDITDRKRAENALRESEEKYRILVEKSHEGILVVQDGIHKFVNPAATRIWGYSEEELLSRPFGDLIHPDDKDMVLDRHGRRAKGEKLPGRYPFRIVTKDGTNRWVEIDSAAISWEGKPAVLVFTSDVTDRKLAEEALKESEEWYRSIVEESFDGIFVHNGVKMVYANSVLHEMLGYSAGELAGMDHWLICHPAYRQEVRERGMARMQGEAVARDFDFQLQRKDGSYFDAEVHAGAVKVKGEPCVRVWVRDVSKRKRLEVVQRRLATAIEQSADAIVITDTQGIVEYVNPAHERITGYTRDEVVGSKTLLFKEQGIGPEFERQFFDSIAAGKVWSSRTVGRRKDGTLYDTDVTISPVRDPNGKIANFVGLERDVTQEIQLQQQLLQAQKMEAVGTLAGGIAHDFNNLLTVVQGFSELLLDEKDQKHPEYEDLQKIFHAARNGADLVQRLLMFSRKSEPKPVPMSLNKQVLQVEKLLRRTIPKMVDIHLDLTPDLPRINADPSQVEQVIMNLAVNARDAMPDKGKLTVGTYGRALDEEYCRLHVEASPGEYVVLEVSDTGHGMDKETVEHIFEPFFTTKEMGRGTGLGLAMVYGIVQQHRGQITVHSEVGKGTTFKVYLPAIEGEGETDVETTGAMPAFGTETVLLVDDEEHVRELGTRILTEHGYTVLKAENGRQALDLFGKEQSMIALVVLDLIMPEMGGTECLTELLKIDPNVRVLIASGYSTDASVKETIQMGAKGFVTKPFGVKDLLRDVRRVLDEG
jgi:two-component system, cell cycle sensor histidine kinase and response regulator CckA